MTRIALAGGLLAVLVGCESRITGNEGNFEFSYPADDSVLDFNKPVAVGAFLDMTVREAGTRTLVDLSSASFDDAAVLDVDAFSESLVTIEGMGDGAALLTVEGSVDGGESLTDSVNMLSRVPEVLVLRHTCGELATSGTYLTDQRVWVPFEMEMDNGQSVIGYGYYPVTVTGTGAQLRDADSNQQWMAFDTDETGGTVTLTSDIDDATLELEVVAESAIDGVNEPVAWVLEDIDVGDINPFYVLPTVSGIPVCQAEVEKAVASDTPSICEVRERESAALSGDEQYEYGWFEVEGVAEGTCLYTVTYPSGNGGSGASAQFSYEIQP